MIQIDKKFNAELKSEAIDKENFIISFIALSSDNRHKRFSIFNEPYWLSVDTKSVDFKATKLYKDHEPTFDNAVGSIIDTKFEDGNIKVRVKFSKDVPSSLEAFNKYQAGLSDSVSVGFGQADIIELEKIDGIPHYHIKSGEIVELSAVWQGADPNAKITKFSQQTNLKNSNEAKQIAELAELTGFNDLALKAIADSKSYNDFLLEVKEAKLNQEKLETINFNKEKNMNKSEFSLANVIKSTIDNRVDLGFEREFAGAKGFALPNEFYAKFADEISTTSHTSIVNKEYRGDLLIKDLKLESDILNRVTWLENLSAEVDIPRDNSDVSATFVDEGNAPANSALAFDLIHLKPHTLAVKVTVTRKMLNMSAFDLESYVYTTMRKALRNKIESTLFYGDTGSINGLFVKSGIPALATGYIQAPDLAKSLEFISKFYENKLIPDKAVFALNGADSAKLMGISREQNTERKLLENGELIGYKAIKTTHINMGDIVFGDFSKCYIGSFGRLEILPRSVSGGNIEIEAFWDIDLQIVSEKSFVVSKKA